MSTFTVSARGKSSNESISDFLRTNYLDLPLEQIESVFGFVEKSTLYGGRQFSVPQLSDRDVSVMNHAGIGLRLPLTNHIATIEEYNANKTLLSKYHNNVNSIICTNDELASWIRNDYPGYEIEASVIKNINNRQKVEAAMVLYDTVVLPMQSNDDVDFLSTISDKSRIRLFANGGCAYTCPSKVCYRSVSEMNKFNGGEFLCSQSIKYRESKGMISFDIQYLSRLGFHKFKLLRSHIGNKTGY